MKKIILLFVLCIAFGSAYSQNVKNDTINGAVSAEEVQVSKRGASKIDAGLRAKAKELTRDLLEKGRLQFEPEYGRYHGVYKNLHHTKYTKRAVNTISAEGTALGWNEDKTGGDYSGRPVIQIFNKHFYCNLDIILKSSSNTADRNKNSKKDSGSASDLSSSSTSKATTEEEYTDQLQIKPMSDSDTFYSDEDDPNAPVFNTEAFEITNIKNPNEYVTTFDVIVKQPFIIDNTQYNQFTFQCAMNILNAKMAVRIIAGEDRICTTYHGDMEYIRGGSF